jgi:hypothetical protein
MPSVTYRVASIKKRDLGTLAGATAQLLSCDGQSPTDTSSVSIGLEKLAYGKPWLVIHCKPRPVDAGELASRLKAVLVALGSVSADAHVYIYYDVDGEKLA